MIDTSFPFSHDGNWGSGAEMPMKLSGTKPRKRGDVGRAWGADLERILTSRRVACRHRHALRSVHSDVLRRSR